MRSTGFCSEHESSGGGREDAVMGCVHQGAALPKVCGPVLGCVLQGAAELGGVGSVIQSCISEGAELSRWWVGCSTGLCPADSSTVLGGEGAVPVFVHQGAALPRELGRGAVVG